MYYLRYLIMNRKQWKEFCKTDPKEAYFWYNKARKKLISKEFESDERTDRDAKVIHHLQDTEEQRKYNDEHYELFGFELDENGGESFEYGKYVLFWTKEHHNTYHHGSEITNKKRSESSKRSWTNERRALATGKHMSAETKDKISLSMKAVWANDSERRQQYSERFSGQSSPRYGISVSDETKKKISDAKTGHVTSDETREKLSNALKHSWDIKREIYGFAPSTRCSGFTHSDETKKKIGDANRGRKASDELRAKLSESHKGYVMSDERRSASKARMARVKDLYSMYKEHGGTLKWQRFQSFLAKNHYDESILGLPFDEYYDIEEMDDAC